MRQRLTPQSLAHSIGYRADRRHSTVPNNSLALRLPFAPLGAVRLLGREGLSHELHRVSNLAGVIHLQLDVAVAPEPEIGDCCSACNFDPQYQATSIAYRADRRATHAPNNMHGSAARSRRKTLAPRLRLTVSRQAQTTSPAGSLLRRPLAESSTGVDSLSLIGPSEGFQCIDPGVLARDRCRVE